MNCLLLFLAACLAAGAAASVPDGCAAGEWREGERVKVFFDQDVLAASSNILSLVMLLQDPRVQVVGVGVVGGDSNIHDALHHTLQAVQLSGHAHDVPVAVGAGRPFLNGKALVHARMHLWGAKGGDGWLGEYGDFSPSGTFVRKVPGVADPELKPVDKSAAELFIELARKHKGELVLVTAGPLTNIAYAVSIAPDIVQHVKAVYTMASALRVRSKFNFWWDAESAAVFLAQPWRRKFIVPIDVCQSTNFTRALHQHSLPPAGPLRTWLDLMYAQPWAEFHLPMWDELTVALSLDGSLVTGAERLYIDTDYQTGPNYGSTLWWTESDAARQGLPARWDGEDIAPWCAVTAVDVARFYAQYSAITTTAPGRDEL